MKRVLCGLSLALSLAARPAMADEPLQLQPATEAERATLAPLIAEAVIAWRDHDIQTILATAGPSFIGLLQHERDLSLTLPAEKLLPPFAGAEKPCVMLWTTARILALRQSYGPDALAGLSANELLRSALQLEWGADGMLLRDFPPGSPEAQRLADAPFPTLRAGQKLGVVDGRAYLVAGNWAHVIALQDAAGEWRFDYRYFLIVEELEQQVMWAYALMSLAVDPRGGKPEPRDWPRDIYLQGLGSYLPGKPVLQALHGLAEAPEPDPGTACWRALLAPPLFYCLADDDKRWVACGV